MKIKESKLRNSIRLILLKEQKNNKDLKTWFDTDQTKINKNLENKKKFKYSYNIKTGEIKIIHHPKKPSISEKNPVDVKKNTRYYNAILKQYNEEVKGKKDNENK